MQKNKIYQDSKQNKKAPEKGLFAQITLFWWDSENKPCISGL